MNTKGLNANVRRACCREAAAALDLRGVFGDRGASAAVEYLNAHPRAYVAFLVAGWPLTWVIRSAAVRRLVAELFRDHLVWRLAAAR